jgi:uncharacterized membrane protein YedE/YeeE
MNLDWSHFTPWTSLAGGWLLGFAAALLILFHGRILGISGILGGLLTPKTAPWAADTFWRLAFLLGLLAAPMVFHALAPAQLITPARIDASDGLIVLAGLLVGLGTRYASGCTSGHGVCGLSQLSLRSWVATASFMGAGFATVYVIRHAI